MDALDRLEKGENGEAIEPASMSEIARNEPEEGDPEHSYALLTKQYGALFKKEENSDDERDINGPLSESVPIQPSNAPKLKEVEKKRIYERFGNQVGIDILANNKVASQIPSEFFLRNSTIALEDNDEYHDILFDPPPFDSGKNYYNMFWGSFIENERILNEI